MLTNTDMTLYNRLYDPDSGVDIYRRTVIRGVSWHSKARVTPEGRGLVNADLYQIRIPFGADTGGKTYQPPGAYTGDETTWTLGQGDKMVKGVTNFEVNQAYTIAELERDFPGTATILSITDNRRGSPYVRHWAVVGG